MRAHWYWAGAGEANWGAGIYSVQDLDSDLFRVCRDRNLPQLGHKRASLHQIRDSTARQKLRRSSGMGRPRNGRALV